MSDTEIIQEITPPPNVRTFIVRSYSPGEALSEVLRFHCLSPHVKATVMPRGSDEGGYLWTVTIELPQHVCTCTCACSIPCTGACGCKQCYAAWAVVRREGEDNRQVIE